MPTVAWEMSTGQRREHPTQADVEGRNSPIGREGQGSGVSWCAQQDTAGTLQCSAVSWCAQQDTAGTLQCSAVSWCAQQDTAGTLQCYKPLVDCAFSNTLTCTSCMPVWKRDDMAIL